MVQLAPKTGRYHPKNSQHNFFRSIYPGIHFPDWTISPWPAAGHHSLLKSARLPAGCAPVTVAHSDAPGIPAILVQKGPGYRQKSRNITSLTGVSRTFFLPAKAHRRRPAKHCQIWLQRVAPGVARDTPQDTATYSPSPVDSNLKLMRLQA